MNRGTMRARALAAGAVILLTIGTDTGRVAGQRPDVKGPEAAVIGALEFRALGPAVMGGRVSDVEAVETDPRVIYAGVASGGVWKTVDGGTSWIPVLDRENVSTIGDVAIAQSNPDIVWVGSGDKSGYGSSGWGDGVYRSLDGGKTWRNMGLRDTHHIGRVVIDPTNPSRVFVAAVGHGWGPNAERGVFRTEDAGDTWQHTLNLGAETGVGDLAIASDDPRTLFAAAYGARGVTTIAKADRDDDTIAADEAGQPAAAAAAQETPSTAAGVYRSTDGGATWQRLTGGLPDRNIGRIGLDVCRANPSVVYAVIAGQGLYRSADRGESWTPVSRQHSGRFGQVRVDPTNCDRVWIAVADPLAYSEDGGKTFCSSEDGRPDTFCSHWLERVHFDTHGLWINPRDADQMILATDGGLYMTRSRARTWDYIQHLPLAQFYQIGYDMQDPYYVYGGMQDTGTWSGPSRSMWTMGITNEDWFGVLVGDGYYVTVDPTDANTIYAEYQGGRFFRINRRTWERRDIRPIAPEGEADYRVLGGNHPLLVSRHDPKTIYVGGNRLFRSVDRGETWTRTTDLTGGAGAMTSLDESPLTPDVLWVGTDDGHVQVSRDRGVTWKDVAAAIPGVPARTYVGRVVASAADTAAAYVTFNGHWKNDYRPYVFRTADYGATWQPLAATLPDGLVVKVLREHPRSHNLLFLGTESGLFVSFDRGIRWVPFRSNLPPIRVDDLAIHPRENDLVLGTHGRGLFVLDDITPLEQISAITETESLHLFDVRPATMWRLYNHRTNLGPGHRVFIAPNPPYGALITYYVGEKNLAGNQARITVTDRQGRVVKAFTGPAKTGLNRTAWDLRYGTPLTPPEALRLQPNPPGQPGGPRMRLLALSLGPFVLPADYTVRVAVGEHVATTTVHVREDPRITVSGDELLRHRQTWHRLLTLYLGANDMFNRTVAMRDALQTWSADIAGRAKASSERSLLADVATLRASLEALVPRIGMSRDQGVNTATYLDPGTSYGTALANRAGQLLLTIGGYTAAPTPRQAQLLDELTAEYTRLRDQVNAVIDNDIPSVNRRARAAGLPLLDVPPRLLPLADPVLLEGRGATRAGA